MEKVAIIGEREIVNNWEEAKAALDMTPILSRIFVHRLRLTRVGNIIIPNTKHSMELSEGIVVAAGKDCIITKEGDYILFGRYAGAQVDRNGQEYVLLNEEDILAIKKEAE